MIRRTDAPEPGPLLPEQLQAAHPRLRVDRLRRYLRSGRVDATATARDLDAWAALFAQNNEPPLLVLILELVGQLPDPRVLLMARRGIDHPGDGVRLEALRILFDALPQETAPLTARFRDDRSLEVRLLVADRLMAHDRKGALELALEILRTEAQGPREHHALERVAELLVEAGAREVAPQLRAAAAELDDPEGFIPWALERLEGSPSG